MRIALQPTVLQRTNLFAASGNAPATLQKTTLMVDEITEAPRRTLSCQTEFLDCPGATKFHWVVDCVATAEKKKRVRSQMSLAVWKQRRTLRRSKKPWDHSTYMVGRSDTKHKMRSSRLQATTHSARAALLPGQCFEAGLQATTTVIHQRRSVYKPGQTCVLCLTTSARFRTFLGGRASSVAKIMH